MKPIKMTAIVATLLVGAALTAHAGDHRQEPKLESITKGDFVLQAVERFDAMDADKDGVLTRQEMREAFRTRMLEHKKEFKREHRDEKSDKAEKRERREREERQRQHDSR
jgi:hypothetical protein